MLKPMMSKLLIGSISKSVMSVIAQSALCMQLQPAPHEALTDQDYQRAVDHLSYHLNRYVDRAGVRANWIGHTNHFWYQVLTEAGSEYILVDAGKGTRESAFNQQSL